MVNNKIIPSELRGRICPCIQCFPFIKERAESSSVFALHEEEDLSEDDDPPNTYRVACDDDMMVVTMAEAVDPSIVKPTEEALRESMDPECDVWSIRYGARIIAPHDDRYKVRSTHASRLAAKADGNSNNRENQGERYGRT
jgi:hypothetical protein